MIENAGTAIRFLAPTEEMFADAGNFVGYSMRVRGELDCEALSDAFAALRSWHPELSAWLGTIDGRYVFANATGPLPGLSLLEGDIDTPLLEVEADPGRILSDLRVVRDGTRATVTLLIHHSVADATHGLALVADLWSLYTDRMHGATVAFDPDEFPASLEEVLAERGISRPDRLDTRLTAETDDDPVPLSVVEGGRDYPSVPARCLLSVAATAALVEFGRRNDVTVHGLVSAAIIRAYSEVSAVPVADVSYVSPIDLRSRTTPPVAATAVTDMLGYSPYQADSEGADIVRLGRSISDRLRAQLDDGSVHIGALYIPDLAKNSPRPGSVTGLLGTNWGVIPRFRTPDRLEIEDFRPASHRKPPNGQLPTNGVSGRETYFIATFADRLSVELASFDPSPDGVATVTKKLAALEHHLGSLPSCI